MTGESAAPEAAADQLALDRVLDAIGPLDATAMATAAAHLDRLTKPPGSLGQLETVVIELAGITGRADASVEQCVVVVAAGDHGVTRQGVSAYPSDVTAQMVANFVAGGAAINVLGAWAGLRVVVVDAGVASPIPTLGADPARGGRLVQARIRDGTGDMTVGPAMTRAEALRAIATGIDLAGELVAGGVDLLGIGEMGIGNTTAASAICAVLARRLVAEVTGRGTGIDDATHRHKIAAIERALEVNSPDRGDPIGVLAAVGGLEIALLVGVIVGAADACIPVVLDGFITGAAALVAVALQPAVAPRLIAAHRSIEPGHAVMLETLGRRPLLDLDLRLGEGTGAALAMGLIKAAVRVRDEMATFESAAISGPTAATFRATQAGSDMAGIILVRHVATAWTGSRYCGRSDPPLDTAGVAVAHRLAGDLATTLAPGTRIVTSPSRRAHATATAIADAAGIGDITIDDRWCEADFGIAEGLTFNELERLAPDLARRLADGETEIDWPDGECAADLAGRVTAAWGDLIAAGGDMLVVSHAGPLRIALGLATGRAPSTVELPAAGAVIRLRPAVSGLSLA